MKYQAVVNMCGCEEYTIQAPSAAELARMLEVITDVEWDGNGLLQLCDDDGFVRLEDCVVFFTYV